MTRAELLPFAREELVLRERTYPKQVREERMSADDAGRGLAAWRAIAALLERGQTEFEACLGETAHDAWPELLDAVDKAMGHRARSNSPAASALRHLRTLLVRSAARQGVSFEQRIAA